MLRRVVTRVTPDRTTLTEPETRLSTHVGTCTGAAPYPRVARDIVHSDDREVATVARVAELHRGVCLQVCCDRVCAE